MGFVKKLTKSWSLTKTKHCNVVSWCFLKTYLLDVAISSLPHIVELDHTGKRFPWQLRETRKSIN